MKRVMTLIALLLTAQLATAADNPIEIGTVHWGRDLDAAQIRSAESGRPVFVLFQEVPGCSGCQEFGKTVLSHPLLVEAIEDEFLPVLVFNNRSGADAALLQRFGEPAWNFQVVRFLNAAGDDIIPRKDRVWTVGALAGRMVEALQTAKRPVPPYLEAVASENRVDRLAEVAFASHCFWVGETQIGRINGVITTEAGWLEGREVTRVIYDPSILSLQELSERARAADSALKVYAPGDAAGVLVGFATGQLDDSYRPAGSSDQKKQLAGWSTLRRVPDLTDMQITKLNAFAPISRAKALEWLSPRQRRALE